jgi:ribosome recycling factor
MIDSLIQNTQTQMTKSVASFTEDLSKLRTGRATPSLLGQSFGRLLRNTDPNRSNGCDQYS